jgi:hypothetical protein
MSRRLNTTSYMLLFAVAIGCGQGDPSSSNETDAVLAPASPEYTADPADTQPSEAPAGAGILPAGELAQRLNIDYWVISDTSLEGYSASNELLSQFVLDADAGVVESVLPEAGFKMLDESENTLTEASRAHLDAVISDLERVADPNAGVEAQVNDGSTPPSDIGTAQMALTVACFTTVSGCQAAGVLGIIDGRWRAFSCENRSLFGCQAPFPIALVI